MSITSIYTRIFVYLCYKAHKHNPKTLKLFTNWCCMGVRINRNNNVIVEHTEHFFHSFFGFSELSTEYVYDICVGLISISQLYNFENDLLTL